MNKLNLGTGINNTQLRQNLEKLRALATKETALNMRGGKTNTSLNQSVKISELGNAPIKRNSPWEA